jgi:hypothetical protein
MMRKETEREWPVRTSSVIARAMSCVAMVAVGVLVSCASLGGGARDDFAKTTNCPPDRVTVVPRPDYRVTLPPEPSPPADVAADPGRLAYWRQQQHAARSKQQNPDCDFFEVSGCGKRVILCCDHPTTASGTRTDIGQVDCAWRYALPQSGAPAPSAP